MIKNQSLKIRITYWVKTYTENEKHIVSFDLSLIWDELQRLESDVTGSLDIAEFSTVKRDKRDEKKNSKFQDILYSRLNLVSSFQDILILIEPFPLPFTPV